MAQVLPLVALGVVVETRAISASWTPATPRGLRVVQSTMWAAILIATAFGESQALAGARGDSPAHWWVDACEGAVSWGLAVLVVSPALELLVKGNAETFATALTWHPFRQIHIWWLKRSSQKLASALHVKQAQLEGLVEQKAELLGVLTARLEDSEPRVAALRERLRELDDDDPQTVEQRLELTALVEEYDEIVEMTDRWRAKIPGDREFVEGERTSLEESMKDRQQRSLELEAEYRRAKREQREAFTKAILEANVMMGGLERGLDDLQKSDDDADTAADRSDPGRSDLT